MRSKLIAVVGIAIGVMLGYQLEPIGAQQFQVVQGERPRGAIPGPAFAAVMGQPPLPTKGAPVARPRGATPTPFAKILAAPKHQFRIGAPSKFFAIPPRLSYWLNNQYGDCVTAEEVFSLAAYSTMLGLPEVFVTDATVYQWAKSHGVLNGADLTQVMDMMARDGITAEDGKLYKDGPYSAVDYTNDAVLRSAIAIGPVKLGVAANQIEATVGQSSGWVATNWVRDNSEDHNVSLCGYGTMAECCAALNVAVPAGANPADPSYVMFTWNTLGVVNQRSMVNVSSEGWVRNPTTVGLTPAPDPNPDPNPNPTPVPPNPTPTPTPSPNMVWVGFDSTSKSVMLPVGWTARTGLAPQQVNAHLGSLFVAVPQGWTAMTSVPVVGSE